MDVLVIAFFVTNQRELHRGRYRGLPCRARWCFLFIVCKTITGCWWSPSLPWKCYRAMEYCNELYTTMQNILDSRWSIVRPYYVTLLRWLKVHGCYAGRPRVINGMHGEEENIIRFNIPNCPGRYLLLYKWQMNEVGSSFFIRIVHGCFTATPSILKMFFMFLQSFHCGDVYLGMCIRLNIWLQRLSIVIATGMHDHPRDQHTFHANRKQNISPIFLPNDVKNSEFETKLEFEN